jgi:pyruvate dehydrogenase E2 component (dihydrolipoamide acetyltransferase)
VATEIKLPRLGQGMEAGTIVKWLKSEGEQVEKGEPLYELDTDKVTQEVESDASGVLLRIAVAEGEVEVGRTIAFIGERGEDIAEPADAGSAEEKRTVEEGGEEERSRARQEASTNGAPHERRPDAAAVGGRIKASPLARRIARERGIDLAGLRGTGPDGRIVAEDVERAAEAPVPRAVPAAPPATAAGEVETRPLTSVRRTIARRLTEAWTVPVFQLTVSVDMTRADALLRKLREANPDVRITATDVLTRLSAAALMRHRDVNAQFTGDAIVVFGSASIGIAVAAPQGLVVPVVHAAERLTIPQIAAVRADLVSRAREARLRAEDLEGGTFTISNLGMFGVEQFVAVLNPPQAAILAVGSTEDRVVAVDGAPAVRPTMTMTLTCDHRAVDGASGADFLQTLKASLEEPGLAL